MSKKIKIDKWGIHEAMDRISVIADHIENTLGRHPAIVQNEVLAGKLDRALGHLYDMYEAIGDIKPKDYKS